jgi:hypothetical protein
MDSIYHTRGTVLNPQADVVGMKRSVRRTVAMTEDEGREDGGGPAPCAGKMSEAEIDRNLQETFPASDPPSWTLGIDHRDGEPAEKEVDTKTQGHG